ncbi:MAG TPA: peptidylprolyl isomerase [Planctomycetota bacterium]|nr:peptidylprolyl isomerase [Planctomycetota bacterium]
MRRFLLAPALLLLSFIAPAQNGATTTKPADPALVRPEQVTIDGVVATVGDAAILNSKVDGAAAGEVRSLEQRQGKPASREQMAFIRSGWLRRLIDTQEMAQGAKTLGILPPAQVEQAIRQRVEEVVTEQERTLGSLPRLSKELMQSHQTWESFERDVRLDESAKLAEQLAVLGRLQFQRNLFITPRMMRDYYRKNRHLYVYGPQSRLAAVAFSPGSDAEAVMVRAKAAAEQWRERELTAKELATMHKGIAPELRELNSVTEDSRKNGSLQEFMIDFALQNPAGTVSEPIARESNLWVLKVIEHQDGRNGAFDDAEVQANLRVQLERLVEAFLRDQALRRARARTYVWTQDELR